MPSPSPKKKKVRHGRKVLMEQVPAAEVEPGLGKGVAVWRKGRRDGQAGGGGARAD